LIKNKAYTEETWRKKEVMRIKARKEVLAETERETVREISRVMSKAMNIW
jgi:hypothetical protein